VPQLRIISDILLHLNITPILWVPWFKFSRTRWESKKKKTHDRGW